ncbi:type I-F CRISPR-associated endoribonuclease Cas6/Csy4 [Azomonas macrocytogenes]|uniref:CRISPR-associated endonuclease Csy4 n=1 Tax=Azomonas macrocytogenes TaxID=69962 RepID=A0A839T4C4_AZOMA|nr:type I-F CRISPR-associated endoribonuclease Cas6/Csy4 [Azomonas macrocytogenes]MBB3102785.1 CRISPR-associated endonuclease Csy4 [Azomonas macrocytogenes]
MDHYLEIRLLPDPEFSATLLMNALFGKLHRGLAEHSAGRIGVSFPDVRDDSHALGQRLRLHGDAAALQQLIRADWTTGLRDHIASGDIAPVPSQARQRIVRRVQAKSNPERLRRRLMARRQIDAEAARQAIPDHLAERLELPYVVLASHSTGQRFRLFIEHLPVQDLAVPGPFTSYGLSSTATVPWF